MRRSLSVVLLLTVGLAAGPLPAALACPDRGQHDQVHTEQMQTEQMKTGQVNTEPGNTDSAQPTSAETDSVSTGTTQAGSAPTGTAAEPVVLQRTEAEQAGSAAGGRDVAYASQSPSQVMDVIHPANQDSAAPAVVLIHGGAFLGGDKSDPDIQALAEAFVARGFVAASVNYRLSGEATFPAAVTDVKAAVRYLRANAARYGIDPNRIAVVGDSAGGYLASMLGATGSSTAFDDASSGNADTSSAVQAVVSRYGPSNFAAMNSQAVCGDASMDHDAADSPESVLLGAPVQTVPELVAKADPASYVADGPTPPFLLEHGTADCLVPPGQTTMLADALQAAGGTATVHLMPEWSHADPRFDEQNDAVVEWVVSALG